MEYAEELLQGLDKINWPEKTKLMQRNWIGKSEGAEIIFPVENYDEIIEVFTTRPDTLFGATYMVLAPEHPLVEIITTDEFRSKVKDYQNSIKSMTEIDRTSAAKEKTGVFTGAHAINPANGKKIPIWIADYVLMSYGTGAIMAVPGQDERDWEFAEKFNLQIIRTIKPPDVFQGKAYIDDGPAINSDFLNGLFVEDAKKKMIEWIEEEGIGKRQVNFRLRDWLISRQRYWGTPIPIIHCPKCGEVPVSEKDLPVELPYDVEFKPTGESPLATNKEFINVKCPKCREDAKRDPDTMDTFVDSSWYYFRYLDPKITTEPFNKKLANKWTPVDMYVGGAEHATMHLLYARFFHKFLRDINLTNSDEPFSTLVHQGTITNQGAKMSKSKGNVVSTDDFISQYGADVFRLYLMFMGPYELGGDWSDKGITGTDRFVQRIYELYNRYPGIFKEVESKDKFDIDLLNELEKEIYRKLHHTIKKCHDEIDSFRFNTAIAALMELLNELKNLDKTFKEFQAYVLERFVVLLAPVAPHLAEECWQIIGKDKAIFEKPVWFKYDDKALVEESVNLAVQINGKLRNTIEMPINIDQNAARKIILQDEKIKKHIDGKQIVKEIFVKNKIYNIVVK
jgi:leucyl-tRNA synthetase